jgi:hypothetical protein
MDNLTPGNPMNAPAMPGQDGPKPSLLASRNGKILIGVLALVLVAAAAVGAFFVFFSGGGDGSNIATVPPVASKSTTQTASIEASPTEPPRKSLQALFTFRNIFRPSSIPVSEQAPTGGTGAPGSASDYSSIPANTLYFISVENTNGQPVANFFWNGAVYSGGAGARLGDTPWQVISISGNSATMMFGDTQITLSVGQGLTK